jgi:hypothetical protein
MSMLYYDRRSVGQSVLVTDLHLGPATNFSFTHLEIIRRQLGVCYDEAALLTKGWVCNLHLLRDMVARLYPREIGSLLSPLTIRRARVKVL